MPCLLAQNDFETNPCSLLGEFSSACGFSDDNRLCKQFAGFQSSEGYFFTSPVINGGIPTNGLLNGVNIQLQTNVTYEITTSVEFVNCNFAIAGGGRILIDPTTNVTIKFTNCNFFGESCRRMWYGIQVKPIASSITFQFVSNKIEDAYQALSLQEGKLRNYYVRKNSFINNHVGITNVLQNYSPINMVLLENSFASNAHLLDNSKIPFTMPQYPKAYAGIVLVKSSFAAANPNIPSSANILKNSFSCIYHGIISDNSVMSAYNCSFQDLELNQGLGIWAIEGTFASIGNTFQGQGYRGIYSYGTNLYALSNTFNGRWREGVHSEGNDNGETIKINDNAFTIANAVGWVKGIHLRRSRVKPVSTTSANEIARNNFMVGNGTSMTSIYVLDNATSANDEIRIHHNPIRYENMTGGFGIHVVCQNGNHIRVYDNDNIRSVNGKMTHGIIFEYQMGIGTDYEINRNRVAGQVDANGLFNIPCAIHNVLGSEGGRTIRYCENVVDNSEFGMHFRGTNTHELRENHINHHLKGMFIDGSSNLIDPQFGRGNTWLPDPNACSLWAIENTNTDPLTSAFRVLETNNATYTYLPPNNKISPDPTSSGFNWFKFDLSTGQDYCDLEPLPLGISNSDLQFISGNTAGLSAALIWEKQRNLYARILSNPSLAPYGSAASTWFGGMFGSSAASFAQVDYQLTQIGQQTSTDLNQLNSIRSQISIKMDDVVNVDAGINMTNPSNITAGNWASRGSALEDAALLAQQEATIESTLNTYFNTDLALLRMQNTALSATQAWQTAQRFLTSVRLSILANEVISDSVYSRLLVLAQQPESSVGSAGDQAIGFLAPCDQVLFAGRICESMVQNRSEILPTEPIGKNENLMIQPNPTTGICRVNLPLNWQGGTLKVYNGYGQLIQTLKVSSTDNTQTIDLRSTQNGSYYIALFGQDSKFIISNKLVILH